jgi:hypothetical protein
VALDYLIALSLQLVGLPRSHEATDLLIDPPFSRLRYIDLCRAQHTVSLEPDSSQDQWQTANTITSPGLSMADSQESTLPGADQVRSVQ